MINRNGLFSSWYLMSNNIVRWKNFKYKLKFECSEAHNVHIQKALTKEQSVIDSVSFMVRVVIYDLLIFKELLSIQE